VTGVQDRSVLALAWATVTSWVRWRAAVRRERREARIRGEQSQGTEYTVDVLRDREGGR
jgi:hypothetical protein